MTVRESSDSRLSTLLSGEGVPLDMVGIGLALGAIHLVFLFSAASPIRFLVAMPLLFLFPGYVLVGSLFPRTGTVRQNQRLGGVRSLSNVRKLDRVSLFERLALSFGLSVALIPFFAFLLELLPVDAFGGTILWALTVFVFLGALVASVRRLRLPTEDRFSLVAESGLGSLAGTTSRAERIVNIALVVSIILAISMAGYALAVPQDGEQFTDLRIMTENDDGDLVLGDFPDEIDVADGEELIIGIDNHEHEPREYTVVVTAEQIVDDDGSIVVIDSTELDRFEVSLDDGERLVQPHTLNPGSAGEFRVNYYLYEGNAPSEPDEDSAYRHVHLTLSASDGSATAPVDGGDTADIEGSIDTDDGAVEPVGSDTDIGAAEPSSNEDDDSDAEPTSDEVDGDGADDGETDEVDDDETDTDETDGDEADGDETDTDEADGDDTDTDETDGDEVDETETDTDETDGDEADTDEIDTGDEDDETASAPNETETEA